MERKEKIFEDGELQGEELMREINQNPERWYNSMVRWYKAHKYVDKAGDMVSGGIEDLGYYGGSR